MIKIFQNRSAHIKHLNSTNAHKPSTGKQEKASKANFAKYHSLMCTNGRRGHPTCDLLQRLGNKKKEKNFNHHFFCLQFLPNPQSTARKFCPGRSNSSSSSRKRPNIIISRKSRINGYPAKIVRRTKKKRNSDGKNMAKF